jgi:hypothetical protein
MILPTEKEKKKMDVHINGSVIATFLVCLLFASAVFVVIFKWDAIVASVTSPKPSVNVFTYTKSLTVNFKVEDQSISTILTDEGAASFFSSSAKPFSYLSTDLPVSLGAYPALLSQTWTTVLDQGSYQEVITDVDDCYPVLVPVTVPGTNSTDMTVNLSPYLGKLVERGTPAITTTVYAYNSSDGLYDKHATLYNGIPEINDTYSKWQIQYTITVAGDTTVEIAAGTIYLPIYPGLSVTTCTFNNAAITPVADTTGTLTGIAGYAIPFPDLPGGSTNTLTVRLSLTPSATYGNYVTTFYECSACPNPNALLRWWTDETSLVYIDVGGP